MFEHIYFKDYVALVFLWLGTILWAYGAYKPRKSLAMYSAVFVIAFAFIMNLYLSTVFSENVKLFNSSKTLECKVDGTKYLVKKSNNYSIKDKYFTKNDLLILIIDCEEL
jgi:hypothetical protein